MFRWKPTIGVLLILQSLPNAYSLTVVSDIDDTIKISNVANPLDLVILASVKRNPFTGFPETYQAIRDNRNAQFTYLSGGPRLISVLVQNFLDLFNFPDGQLILKTSADAKSIEDYKFNHLVKILDQNPEETFILIGDDTQSDPEAYARISARNPRQIEKIYIHAIRRRALPDNSPVKEVAFQSAYDLSFHLYQDQSIQAADLIQVGQTIINERYSDLIIPRFQKCEVPYLIPKIENEEEINRMSRLVVKKIRKICKF